MDQIIQETDWELSPAVPVGVSEHGWKPRGDWSLKPEAPLGTVRLAELLQLLALPCKSAPGDPALTRAGFEVATVVMLSHFGSENMFALPSTRSSVTILLSGNNGHANEVDLWY